MLPRLFFVVILIELLMVVIDTSTLKLLFVFCNAKSLRELKLIRLGYSYEISCQLINRLQSFFLTHRTFD